MRWIGIAAGIVAVVIATACENREEAPPPTEEEITADASEAFDPAAYDTVSWTSDSAAIARGRDIFKWACAECHGETGMGDGGRVVDGDTLRPPSFLVQDWPFADDPEALHRKVFVGNSLGMPHWGLRQMRPRDIVAVERFVRLELIQDRPAPDTAGG